MCSFVHPFSSFLWVTKNSKKLAVFKKPRLNKVKNCSYVKQIISASEEILNKMSI